MKTTEFLLKAGANPHLNDKVYMYMYVNQYSPSPLPYPLPLLLRNGLTPLDVATTTNNGDAEGVSRALQMYMQESATAHSHHVSVYILW